MNFSNVRSQQPKFWLLHLGLPLITGLLLVFLYPQTGLDAFWINPFYDAHSLVFPLKNDWFLENVMHQGLKYLIIVASLVMLFLWILGLKRGASSTIKHDNKSAITNLFSPQYAWVQVYHRQFIWIFVAMVISTGTISILKHLSNHACPWSLLLYGGSQPLIPLFGNLPFGATPGHCFPGGHASGGFALMAIYFGFKDSKPKIAFIGLMLGFVFGLAMGWGQMMRGAHFMSHNLWTAWIMWMLLLIQYLAWQPNACPTKTPENHYI